MSNRERQATQELMRSIVDGDRAIARLLDTLSSGFKAGVWTAEEVAAELDGAATTVRMSIIRNEAWIKRL